MIHSRLNNLKFHHYQTFNLWNLINLIYLVIWFMEYNQLAETVSDLYKLEVIGYLKPNLGMFC